MICQPSNLPTFQPTSLPPSTLIFRLAALPPADVPAVRLHLELEVLPKEQREDVAYLLGRLPEIEAAMAGLEEQLTRTQGLIKSCQTLTAIPSLDDIPGI